LTAFSRTIRSADELPKAMAEAYRVFERSRPRPVHIEIPLDVLAGAGPEIADRPAAAAASAPDPASIEAAVQLIGVARRPVIIAGGGIVDAGDLLVRFAERIGGAVIPTVAAKGAMPDGHPRCLGSTLSREPTQALLKGADLVIAIATELAETDSWIDRLPITGKLIRIDIDIASLQRDYRPDVAMHADAGMSLQALLSELGSGAGSGIELSEIAELRRNGRAALGPLQKKHALVLDALRAVLPDDGIIATDMTQIAYTGCYYFTCEQPRCWYHPLGYGTLGYALPAAIGAKLATPKRATVALAGDAGFLFTVQELATAVELKLPIAILLWNNDALGQIAEGMTDIGIPEIGVRQKNPDFIALAKAFGCRTARPNSLEDLKSQLTSAFAADGPTLIEVREDSSFLG
jgi:5-guanidino-2-oxopentanoate decarboxylase